MMRSFVDLAHIRCKKNVHLKLSANSVAAKIVFKMRLK